MNACPPTTLQMTQPFLSALVVAITVRGRIKLPTECTAAFAADLANPTHTVGTVVSLGTIVALICNVEMQAATLPHFWKSCVKLH